MMADGEKMSIEERRKYLKLVNLRSCRKGRPRRQRHRLAPLPNTGAAAAITAFLSPCVVRLSYRIEPRQAAFFIRKRGKQGRESS